MDTAPFGVATDPCMEGGSYSKGVQDGHGIRAVVWPIRKPAVIILVILLCLVMPLKSAPVALLPQVLCGNACGRLGRKRPTVLRQGVVVAGVCAVVHRPGDSHRVHYTARGARASLAATGSISPPVWSGSGSRRLPLPRVSVDIPIQRCP